MTLPSITPSHPGFLLAVAFCLWASTPLRAENPPLEKKPHPTNQVESDPSDVDSLCQISDSYGRRITDASGKAEKKRLADKSLHYARAAADRFPEHFLSQRSLAIAYGRKAQQLPALQRVHYAELIHEHAERAYALNPNDAITCRLLGIWNYEMARLSPLIRNLASMALGPLPEGSHKKAIAYLEQAVRLDRDDVESWFYLGEAQMAEGDRPAAEQAWQNVLRFSKDPTTETCKKAKRRLGDAVRD